MVVIPTGTGAASLVDTNIPSRHNFIIPTGSSDAFYLPSCRLNAGHNSHWTDVTDTVALNDGKWHHVALEFRQTNSTVGIMKLWRDGMLVSTNDAAPVPVGITTTTPVIGSFGTSNYYAGLIDDVVIITR